MRHCAVKNWVSPWVTGGVLLGLTGLLPLEVQAVPEGAAVDTLPDSSAAPAELPDSVVMPEPSAQPVAPQANTSAVPQPTWSSGSPKDEAGKPTKESIAVPPSLMAVSIASESSPRVAQQLSSQSPQTARVDTVGLEPTSPLSMPEAVAQIAESFEADATALSLDPLPNPPAAVPLNIEAAETVPLAQAAPEADQIRDNLRIDPLTTAVPTTYIPSSSAGIPTGFGAEWGDFFISATLAGADRVRPEADGSLYMGFGLGDAQRLVGVELAYNLLSIRRFAENGSFDAKVHREIYNQGATQIAGAVGVTSAFPYGSNAIGTESSFYGVVSSAHLLQPNHPTNTLTLNTTLGIGGGNFANGDVGILAGVGLRVHPQFAINTAWSGVGVNVGASIVASAEHPITLNLLYGDIFNNTTAGSVAVISIGYGINSNARF